MKSNIKNSTKKLLLLAAATVTAASAVAIAIGSSYSAYAETEPNIVETPAVFENEQYTGTFTRRAECKITDSGPIKQHCDVFSWLGFPDYRNLVANYYDYVTVTVKLTMKVQGLSTSIFIS